MSVRRSPRNGYNILSKMRTCREDYFIICEDSVLIDFYKSLIGYLFEGKVKTFSSMEISGKKQDSGKEGMYDFYSSIKGGDFEERIMLLCDLDFDDILINGDYQKYSICRNFIYLDKYSIENYFIDENLLVNVLYDHLKGVSEKEIRKKVNFSCWKDEVDKLCELCLAEFLIMKKYGVTNPFLHLSKTENGTKEKDEYYLCDLVDCSNTLSPKLLKNEKYDESILHVEQKCKSSCSLKSNVTLEAHKNIYDNLIKNDKREYIDIIPGKIVLRLFLYHFKDSFRRLTKCANCDGMNCVKKKKRCESVLDSEYCEEKFIKDVRLNVYLVDKFGFLKEKVNDFISYKN